MTAKKDPSRFTVRFNLQDPSHRKAVSILEQQGARNKANYLANAILCYEKAEPKSVGKAQQEISRTDVESIVWEILAKWQTHDVSGVAGTSDITHSINPSEQRQKESMQGATLELISDALAAFRGG